MPSEQRQTIEACIVDRVTFTNSKASQNNVSVILVPLRVYVDMHIRLDRGDTDVCAGAKNVKNRPVIRSRSNGSILASDPDDGREIIPQEIISLLAEESLSAQESPPTLLSMFSEQRKEWQSFARTWVTALTQYWTKGVSNCRIVIYAINPDVVNLNDDSHREEFEMMIADVTHLNNPCAFVWSRFSDGDHLHWPEKKVAVRLQFNEQVDILKNPNAIKNLLPSFAKK